MNIGITIIKSRRSIRAYKDTPVPDAVIHDALECARNAPSARNEQPWLFGVVRDPETLKSIADLTDHGKFIADAKVCFAVFAVRDSKYYLEDACAATEQLILGLWSHGVGSCWVAGEKKAHAEPVRELLSVPGHFTLVSLVPAGYPADITRVSKKDLEDITFYDRWKPAS